jgi:hypothetical protein
MLARWPSRIWKGTSSPRRRLLQPDGESHETCFKRLRRWCSNSATVYLRWRKPLPTSAMVRRASRNAEFCSALRRSRCARHHWAAYDIPPAVTELAVDAAQNAKLKQAVNDFRKVGYGGPCPPHGHGPHHYHVRLLALSTDQLRAKANASCRDIEREARKYAIAEAILVGWYER